MKIVISIFALLPIVLFAQKKLPFIESITSDTLNGKYQQLSFKYDQYNRVTDIFKIEYKLQKTSPNDPFPLIDTVLNQKFSYIGRSKNPIAKKITDYKFDPVEQQSLWSLIKNEIFLYKNGKHVQDSIVLKQNRLKLEEDHIDNDKAINWKGLFKYTDHAITYILDMNYLTKRWGVDYDNGETTEILINSQGNITKEAEEPFYKSHSSSSPPYFTFTKFDKSINPFSYLNIAPYIPNGKISLSYNERNLIKEEELEINLSDNTNFNWYFLNQNNIITYSITRGETNSPIKDIINLSYTYNQFNLPVQCFAVIRKEMEKYGTHLSTLQKRFTFRYRN